MSSPRRGLGDRDPLASRPRRLPPVIPSRITAEDVEAEPRDADEPADQPAPRGTKMVPKSKTQMSAYVDKAVLDAAKDTVIALTATGGPRNLSMLVEQALRHEIARLAQAHNNGEPFPARLVQLQPGRPTI